eukprot:TRINITY_DN2064_c0_g5_i2.p1 TRINITY_DN2064_c0_g5~~TRINITY_DN2064_c0_g5_i2.p1  ORF type:complete len:824 (-),score=243.84 TRINITY_DN2064_c0_g5_i2:830-3301(-)
MGVNDIEGNDAAAEDLAGVVAASSINEEQEQIEEKKEGVDEKHSSADYQQGIHRSDERDETEDAKAQMVSHEVEQVDQQQHQHQQPPSSLLPDETPKQDHINNQKLKVNDSNISERIINEVAPPIDSGVVNNHTSESNTISTHSIDQVTSLVKTFAIEFANDPKHLASSFEQLVLLIVTKHSPQYQQLIPTVTEFLNDKLREDRPKKASVTIDHDTTAPSSAPTTVTTAISKATPASKTAATTSTKAPASPSKVTSSKSAPSHQPSKASISAKTTKPSTSSTTTASKATTTKATTTATTTAKSTAKSTSSNAKTTAPPKATTSKSAPVTKKALSSSSSSATKSAAASAVKSSTPTSSPSKTSSTTTAAKASTSDSAIKKDTKPSIATSSASIKSSPTKPKAPTTSTKTQSTTSTKATTTTPSSPARTTTSISKPTTSSPKTKPTTSTSSPKSKPTTSSPKSSTIKQPAPLKAHITMTVVETVKLEIKPAASKPTTTNKATASKAKPIEPKSNTTVTATTTTTTTATTTSLAPAPSKPLSPRKSPTASRRSAEQHPLAAVATAAIANPKSPGTSRRSQESPKSPGASRRQAPAKESPKSPVSSKRSAQYAKSLFEEPKDTSAGPCGTCGNLVKGEAIEAMGKSFHPHCFICFVCRNQLTGRFALIAANIHCEPCAKQAISAKKNSHNNNSNAHTNNNHHNNNNTQTSTNKSGAQTGQMGLLQWCKNRTQGYAGVEVTNFTKSWGDGLALCALVHSYNSSAIPFGSLNPEEKLKNCTLAIDVAEQMGVNRLIDPEDIVFATPYPEKLSMMTYLSEMYKVLRKLET